LTNSKNTIRLSANKILLDDRNLEGNQFSGNIPYSPQQLSKLTNLNLSHNQLVDAIPDIFTNLNNLQTLDLSFNSLTGPLPGSLGDLAALTVL
jgi:Leucine-rich repeat (LRR) protein